MADITINFETLTWPVRMFFSWLRPRTRVVRFFRRSMPTTDVSERFDAAKMDSINRIKRYQ